ncbi:MAG: DUF4332 domain-containing protein [Geminicoccaceae bacterium]|nr:DUF4332 domain-containing protein [Geminicoccaceae bacterium]
MSYRIEEIEGIGKSYGVKLRAEGLGTTKALLSACADRKGRKSVAEKTGIDETRLLKWANMADLMRIRGIGTQYSELLEAAGVDTVKELRNRNAANLAEALASTNATRKLTRSVPAPKMVESWVAQAKQMAPAISY